MRVMVASVAFLKAAGTGYAIGLNERGDRVEFIGDWRLLAELQAAIDLAGTPQSSNVEDWQVLAINGSLRLPLSKAALAERATFVRAATRQVRHR